ncbi:SDR family oxidoreductase [Candidatus Micrarchaeota archaeon]|nr:SDR family oxidoreductase [Candidatus Micrarchaeota archaeon]
MKTVIVTGGSRGIGFATAKLLSEAGFNVVICSTNESEVKKAAEKINSNVLGVVCDVSKPSQVKKLFDFALREFGSVDFVVNNAGVGKSKALADTSNEEIDSMLDVNVKGMLYCCREAEKLIKKGAIVNVSSFYGENAGANASVYAASKFGVIGLSKSLAAEFYPKIKVFVVCPGSIDTRMLRENFGGRSGAPPEKIGEIILKLITEFEKTDSGTIIQAWKR